MKEQLDMPVAEEALALMPENLGAAAIEAAAESPMERSLRIRQGAVRPIVEGLAIRYLELLVKNNTTKNELDILYTQAQTLCESADFSVEEKKQILAPFHHEEETLPVQVETVPEKESVPIVKTQSTAPKEKITKPSFYSRIKDRVRKGLKWFAVGVAATAAMSGDKGGTETKQHVLPDKKNIKAERAHLGHAAEKSGVQKKVIQIKPKAAETRVYGYEEGSPESEHLKDSTELSTYVVAEESYDSGLAPIFVDPGIDTTGLVAPERTIGHLELDTVLEDGTRVPQSLLSRMDTAYYNNADIAAQVDYLSHVANNENLGARLIEDKVSGKLIVADGNNIVRVTMPNLLGRARGDSLNGSTATDPYAHSYTPAGIFTFQNVSGLASHGEFKDLLHINIPAKEDQGIYIHTLLSNAIASQEKKLASGDKHESHGCMRVRESDMQILSEYFSDTDKHLITVLPEKKVEGMVTFIDPYTLREVSMTPKEAQAFKATIIDNYIKNTIVTKVKKEEHFEFVPKAQAHNGEKTHHYALYMPLRTNIQKTVYKQLLEDKHHYDPQAPLKG